ncbi:MAG TPA: hypothetical protein VJ777_05455, partial [Mycobacterium sp.]|nr:hypothetical protein [Mycobacterium sp.]
MPVIIVGGCIALSYGLRATVWQDVEPAIVAAVEPEGVSRVYTHSLFMGSTDGSSGELVTIFYSTSTDYDRVRDHYIRELGLLGLQWKEHVRPVGTRDGSFTRRGEGLPCI